MRSIADSDHPTGAHRDAFVAPNNSTMPETIIARLFSIGQRCRSNDGGDACVSVSVCEHRTERSLPPIPHQPTPEMHFGNAACRLKRRFSRFLRWNVACSTVVLMSVRELTLLPPRVFNCHSLPRANKHGSSPPAAAIREMRS